jgi:hypothetical protein
MIKQVLVALSLVLALGATAQSTFVSDFEGLTLPDYNNMAYNDSTNGAGGFQNGHAFFPTGWTGFWSTGWAASAVYDSTTAGFANLYGCAAYKGYSNSNKFVVGTTYGDLTIRMTDSLIGRSVMGFYVCNATFAAKSMLNGDMFARKFGDTTGTHCGCAQGSYPDWFKLTVKRYHGGVLQNDSMEVYLADYRFSNSVQDYILKNWVWVNLSTMGNADSLALTLHSSDNGQFGMNTPAYLCMDDLSLSTSVGIAQVGTEASLQVYPNPAVSEAEIIFTTAGAVYASVKIVDVTGREVAAQSLRSFAGLNKIRMDVSQLPKGVYYVALNAGGDVITKKLIKQ